ncbi:endonuclease/exonuclease/phosphatase family protein [Dactylosporangium sp. NPDC005555]|uniref:endonuclease/exonuclease/phosphatase family protein n=1 Tax=Dactylosporangium sp. NPDC005555 TaxID=3154889 RepID=UPI00339E3CC9
MRLATYNVENLFARARALDPADPAKGQPALSAYEEFNRIAAQPVYSDEDKAAMLDALETLRVFVRTRDGRRGNPDLFGDAFAVLRENRGDFLAAPADAEPRIVATGRGSWNGWVDLIVDPVDELATRMTARVVADVAADVLCVVEAESRPSLVKFNDELLGRRYEHAMLVDGNDPRGIDVGLFCVAGVEIDWVRSHVDVVSEGQRLFSRDCPVYRLLLPSGAELYMVLNHLKSQSFTNGDPDPLRTRQATGVRAIYDRLRADGASYVAVVGDFNKRPDHASLRPLLGPDSPLVDAYSLPAFSQLYDPLDRDRERPGSFQSCTIGNRLDYILLSPELAARVTGGGVFRRGLWGTPSNVKRPRLWDAYPEITSARHAASDHGAVWVEVDL